MSLLPSSTRSAAYGSSTQPPPLRPFSRASSRPTWVGFAPFARAYFGEAPPNNARSSTEALEALATFRALFRELRAMDAR